MRFFILSRLAFSWHVQEIEDPSPLEQRLPFWVHTRLAAAHGAGAQILHIWAENEAQAIQRAEQLLLALDRAHGTVTPSASAWRVCHNEGISSTWTLSALRGETAWSVELLMPKLYGSVIVVLAPSAELARLTAERMEAAAMSVASTWGKCG